MSTLENLIKELATQNADAVVGDDEDFGVAAYMIRGDIADLADESGYRVGSRLQETLQGIKGAIVYTSADNDSVLTFTSDDDLDEQWSDTVSAVEAEIESQLNE